MGTRQELTCESTASNCLRACPSLRLRSWKRKSGKRGPDSWEAKNRKTARQLPKSKKQPEHTRDVRNVLESSYTRKAPIANFPSSSVFQSHLLFHRCHNCFDLW